jgi:succinate dehydrogenase / fumarate reductase, membrane anchor subunit
MVNREVVGAHYGTRDWLAQRVTAVVMLIYTVFLLVVLLRLPQLDFENWRAMWASPVVQYSTVLFIVSLLYHAWVGMRNILMDYVKDLGLRLVLDVLVILAALWYGAWTIQILWGA